MSTNAVVGAFTTHVTINKGELVAQFYIDRSGMTPPVSVRMGGTGYQIRAKDPDIDLLPAELREDATKAIEKWRTYFILKGDT